MITISGYFLTAFVPIAVMSFLGFCCLWQYRHSEWNYRIFFLAAVFLFMISWRMPVVASHRYVLPVIVVGVLFAALFLKTLSGRIAPVGRWLCGILLLGTAIAGTAKAMRFQESKPYLTDMPAMIHQEIRQHQWNHALVLALGNLGGDFKFSDSVTLQYILKQQKFSSSECQEAFFESINCCEPECLLLRYPVLYILISSTEPGEDFSEKWQTRYGRAPEFCYEFVRPKDRMRYQMFRVVSPYYSARLTGEQRLGKLRQFNLLPNPDFSQMQNLSGESTEMRELTSRGMRRRKNSGPIHVPVGWNFDLESWRKDVWPAGLEYTDQRKLRLFGRGRVALLQTSKPFGGGEVYQLGGSLTVRKTSVFHVQTVQMQNGEMISQSKVFAKTMRPGVYEFAGLVDLSGWPGEWFVRFGLQYGDIELESIYLVEQSVFNDTTQGKK